MKIIARRSLQFAVTHGNGLTTHLNIPRGNEPVEIPDACAESNTFKIGLKAGSFWLVPAYTAPGTIVPPTVEAVMAGGRTQEEAETIVAEETRKYNAGEAPYPSRPAGPTLESLMAMGLTLEAAQAAIDVNSQKAVKPAGAPTLDSLMSVGGLTLEAAQAALDAMANGAKSAAQAKTNGKKTGKKSDDSADTEGNAAGTDQASANGESPAAQAKTVAA